MWLDKAIKLELQHNQQRALSLSTLTHTYVAKFLAPQSQSLIVGHQPVDNTTLVHCLSAAPDKQSLALSSTE
jgi:hypothetical protein